MFFFFSMFSWEFFILSVLLEYLDSRENTYSNKKVFMCGQCLPKLVLRFASMPCLVCQVAGRLKYVFAFYSNFA